VGVGDNVEGDVARRRRHIGHRLGAVGDHRRTIGDPAATSLATKRNQREAERSLHGFA
jgi:hypothetical protein